MASKFIGADDAGQEVLQGLSFAFRERGHDTIPHRQNGRVQPNVEVEPCRCEAKEGMVAFGSGHPTDQPPKLKVFHHALDTGEIDADPLGQSALPSSRRVVKRSKDRRFDGGQSLWAGDVPQRAGENPVEAPRQVVFVATVNWWKCPRYRTA